VAKRLTIFILISSLVLPIGYIGAGLLWGHFHHRYEMPETGLYRGLVTAMFDSLEEPYYTLNFRAETPLRWYWRQPTNFSYTTLEVEWREEATSRHAIVTLPAFTYRSGDASGDFTRGVLFTWLFGATNQVSNNQQVEAIFGYFEAAARGELPPPRHHTYYFEQPVRGSIQHFLLGYGVGSTTYIWVLIWTVSVAYVGRRICKRERGANLEPEAKPNT